MANTDTVLKRKPSWLKVRLPAGPNYLRLRHDFRELELHTVCEEAHCPNLSECWRDGTATIMILGDVCTRGCRFCAVKTGKTGTPVDLGEPQRVAEALARMKLRYVVITSVDRDDLADGGADIFARTITETKKRCPELIIEALIPDFQGNPTALSAVVDAGPEVIGQNIETVKRLTRYARDRRSGYEQTLRVLENVKHRNPEIYTKSALLLGMGESESEVLDTMKDLRAHNVDILTLGQYLCPSRKHLPVVEYLNPEKFAEYEHAGVELGFSYVASGAMVRSSYKAAEFFIANLVDGHPGRRSEHDIYQP
jgi:lipoic acid synthetase